METYKKLTAVEISIKLMNRDERSEFGHDADRGDRYEQLEDASYALDINFDYLIAEKMISKGADLSDTLARSQVEFCCE